ncbi:JAB domain-containing protein [Polyangium jinanense]|uniref:DNA repair protein n=1 Tax=Polyangium jinanense TaxID=2829994 RepID=A0A9X3X907_9BACT|nr:JAB domain-containing protein [Polyangium jinanense]MDC3985937.1 DNA repair protein [Polyangium jinanense]
MTGSPDASLTASIINIEQSTTENLIDHVLGRPGVAAHLLESLGSLAALARLSPEALTERLALAPDEAIRILAAFELGHRRLIEGTDAPRILSCLEVVAWAHPRLGHLAHEEMHLLALSGQGALRGARLIARGGLHALAVRPSDILRAGLELAASGFVLVHNHPSGNPDPSLEDIALTRRMQESADLLGMPLIDHVIVVASGRFSSFVANQWTSQSSSQ